MCPGHSVCTDGALAVRSVTITTQEGVAIKAMASVSSFWIMKFSSLVVLIISNVTASYSTAQGAPGDQITLPPTQVSPNVPGKIPPADVPSSELQAGSGKREGGGPLTLGKLWEGDEAECLYSIPVQMVTPDDQGSTPFRKKSTARRPQSSHSTIHFPPC